MQRINVHHKFRELQRDIFFGFRIFQKVNFCAFFTEFLDTFLGVSAMFYDGI